MPAPFEITLPATSANLGPAFDAAAIAMRLHYRVRAAAADEFRIVARGRDPEICGRIDRNVLLETYYEVFEALGRDPVPLAIEIDNCIPIGKGLGSSAAARLAAIAMAVHFGELGWSDGRILTEAARREQHGDNAAACWLGGVTLVHSNGSGSDPNADVGVLKLRARNEWPLLLAVTDSLLNTEHSRSVLPEYYSRTDVVCNVQRAMLLAAAFVEGRPELFLHALEDRIHEPYRGPLCPLLAPLRSLSGKQGVLGAALSGSGPSVLVVLDPAVPPEQTRRQIAGFLSERGLHAELLLTSMENRGARARRRPNLRPMLRPEI